MTELKVVGIDKFAGMVRDHDEAVEAVFCIMKDKEGRVTIITSDTDIGQMLYMMERSKELILG